jgi:hypothetical protein
MKFKILYQYLKGIVSEIRELGIGIVLQMVLLDRYEVLDIPT